MERIINFSWDKIPRYTFFEITSYLHHQAEKMLYPLFRDYKIKHNFDNASSNITLSTLFYKTGDYND